MEKAMNIKIQNSGKNGATNTKGSSRALAQYCEHEDDERRKLGKTVFPFATADGTPVTTEEVIDKIDRNGVCLHKEEDRHYMITINPSASEVRAMGKDDQEIYENAKILMKYILDAYAEGFHNDAVSDRSDLEVFWKPHYTRGENGEDQFHIHVIVSRRAKGKGAKISPMTNHRDTQTGPVKGGFDRKAFFERGEKLFDQLFNYERKVAESFEYLNAMAHGTAEEKAQQAERLARENEASLRAEMTAALEKRRKRKRQMAEAEEINEAIKKGSLVLPTPEKNLAEALEIASLTPGIQECFATSEDRLFLELNLMAMGLSCRSEMAPDGGVQDLLFTRRGQVIKASDLFDEAQLKHLLDRWEALTGEEPAYKVKARKAARQKEEQFRKLKEALTPETTARKRGLHL